jgi:Spy/CpxP family protein refolding chaperone
MKTRFLYLVIVVLLLLNAGSLAFMIMHRPHRGGPPEVAHWLAAELKLTTEQEQQYKQLLQQHREKMDAIQQTDRELHDRFFAQLKTAEPDTLLVNSIADSIAANRVQIELLTFNHFRQIRSICTVEQQQKFDAVIDEVLHRMAPGRPGPPR